jgi:hypothetical protein
MQQGKILDYWKSYARDVCPLIFYYTAALVSNILDANLSILRMQELAIKKKNIAG